MNGQRAGQIWATAKGCCIPNADKKIVFDRYHIMGHMGEAVDTVRKQEHRDLQERGDDTLKGSKYLWLYGRENVPEKRKREFVALQRKGLKVGRAWAIKEMLRELWHYLYLGSATKFWKKWYYWASHSRLQPVCEAAATIRRHIDNV